MNESLLTDAKKDTYIPPYVPPPSHVPAAAVEEKPKQPSEKATSVLVVKPDAKPFSGLAW